MRDALDRKLVKSLWVTAVLTGFLLVLLGLIGCSAKMNDVGSTTLQPMPTTITSEVREPEVMFFDLVLMASPKAYDIMTGTEIFAQADLYCAAAGMGMTHSALHSSINEAAYTQEQQELEHIIMHQALTWLCPEQEYRVNP